MGSQSQSEAGSLLACIVQAVPVSTVAVEELQYRMWGMR